MNFDKTHKNVENSNIIFQTPQVGDIVETFGKIAVVTHDFSKSNERSPFCVAFIETEGEAMPFKSEMRVIWKRNDNWNDCKVAEINTISVATTIAMQFQKEII